MRFSQALAVGREAEQHFCRLLAKEGVESWTSQDGSYDVGAVVQGRTLLFEVKYDLKSAHTGNLAIEHWNSKSNKPSGLSHTKSDYWVTVLPSPTSVYIAKTQDLRQYCQSTPPVRKVQRAGDSNASIWCYPMHDILTSVFDRVEGNLLNYIMGGP